MGSLLVHPFASGQDWVAPGLGSHLLPPPYPSGLPPGIWGWQAQSHCSDSSPGPALLPGHSFCLELCPSLKHGLLRKCQAFNSQAGAALVVVCAQRFSPPLNRELGLGDGTREQVLWRMRLSSWLGAATRQEATLAGALHCFCDSQSCLDLLHRSLYLPVERMLVFLDLLSGLSHCV